MILEEFDINPKAVFNPDTFHDILGEMPKTCVSFFSKSIMREIVESYPVKQIAKISNATATFPVYKINIDGVALALFQSAVGAPACVSNYEELIAMGIRNFLLVGCCGCLDDKIKEYSIIIPTAAIRDEGTSYHYAVAKDETILNEQVIAVLEKTLKKLSLNYAKGKTWTTDAIFRETKAKVLRRKEQGAIIVDMECSAMNVVSQFRGVKFGQIFYAADNLGGEQYDPRTLMLDVETFDEKKKIIPIALKCGVEMDKNL